MPDLQLCVLITLASPPVRGSAMIILQMLKGSFARSSTHAEGNEAWSDVEPVHVFND